jgi:hypothetical protein
MAAPYTGPVATFAFSANASSPMDAFRLSNDPSRRQAAMALV